MKIVLLLFIFLSQIVFLSADNIYYKCFVKTSFVLSEDEKSVQLDLDVPINGLVVVSNGKYVHDRLWDLGLNGKACFAYIHVDRKYEKHVKSQKYYVGETIKDAIADLEYSKYYPYTVADAKRKIDPEDNVIEYMGEDSNEKAIFINIS